MGLKTCSSGKSYVAPLVPNEPGLRRPEVESADSTGI